MRWWLVDGAAVLAATALFTAAVALAVNARWHAVVARIGVATVLVLGLLTMGVVVLGAATMRGVTGSVGARGVLLFAATVALLLPYVVVFPAVQLIWLKSDRRTSRQT